jgi:hypothetical protein
MGVVGLQINYQTPAPASSWHATTDFRGPDSDPLAPWTSAKVECQSNATAQAQMATVSFAPFPVQYVLSYNHREYEG